MIYGGRPGSEPLAGILAGPSDITATDMILDKTGCVFPCSVTATITWINQGGTVGSFVAGISVDGGTPLLASSPDILSPTQTVTHQFVIDLSPGNHILCPVPN